MNRWKGIDLILEAFAVRLKNTSLRLELHGFSPDLLSQESGFHDLDFLTLAVAYQCLPQSSVRCMGVYEPDELHHVCGC